VNERKTIYYAEGMNGLQTEPPTSLHSYLINYTGGKNIAEVELLPGKGNVQLPGDKARRRMLKLLLPLNPPGGHGPGDELGQKKVVGHALLIPFI